MNTQNLNQAAYGITHKAQEILNNPAVQNAMDKGRDLLDKGMDWLENTDAKKYVDQGIQKGKDYLNSPQGQEAIKKGKDALNDAKDKVDQFIQEKTDGKGILGFGRKE